MGFMKEIFWEMPKDFWQDDGLLGKVVALFWLFLLTLLAAIVFGVAFMVVDRAGLDYVSGEAKVVGKFFDPAHEETYMQTIQSGNTTITIPQTNYYPDRYYLQLQVKGLSGVQQVNLSTYNEIKEGKFVNVKYSKRRITDELSFE